MNLILTLNDQHFAIRSGTNKVALYELPSFNSLHKLYMSCNFSALNQHTL